ncbi:hypothetical protein CCACVL1_20390 [Corchorus capsularis]|uniref:Uncharacterized protein n=1 Tax=Corchorus capsularis TaxID=210143 RepID=A0A1R3HBC5_COCAP|nr:hypothetical protein CCACVL1_20390 [Corchorus capsularis]
MMKMEQEEVRKGPWTEQEDILLVNFVHLFGDRRWDFIAKVSGLNRTGKSCRLRWVNYLHPGLKRGKMTPQEERLVLELHAKWGNRWSRIARKLPGRTDNEIKNYWRTHMRKKAQEKKRAMSPPSSSSSSSTTTTVDSLPFSGTGKASFYDTGGHDDDMVNNALAGKNSSPEFEEEKGYSMDDIWKDIDDIQLSEENNTLMKPLSDNNNNNLISSMASPPWDYCWDSLWNEEESKNMFLPTNNQFLACYEFGFGKAPLTG